jgi:hypothetical protein
MAVRGTEMSFGTWLALPSAFGGCAGALFLVVAGSLLLTLVKIADNFAAAARPAPEIKTAAAPAALVAPTVAVAESSIGHRPPPAGAEPVAAAVTAGAVVAERPGVEAEIPAAGKVVEEAAAVAPLDEATFSEQAEALTEAAPAGMSAVVVAAEVLEPQTAEIPPPEEEIGALQTQLAALQAQLAELEGTPPELEELPAVVEDEGPAPGASEELTLPGADEAARVAAEMAVLESESEAEEPQEH